MLVVLATGMVCVFAVAKAEIAAAQEIVASSSLDRWQAFIAEASRRYGIPEAWIRAVLRAESGGRTTLRGRPITSPAGAIGLMQVMPKTWAELRARYGFGADPYDPRANILAGTAYLRELYERYGYPNLFAAYNAGPGRFDAYLFNGEKLPDETLAYLASLGQPVFEPPRAPIAASGTSLFFPLRTVSGRVANSVPTSSSGGLFVPLNTVPERTP
ncbi:MAG TPA: lytic transglycosylase domain-containing protein [Stellaceae bacterium]|nr:lytic transglycosylase domain-containing protein [Stellaceae bacterium]